MNPSDERRETMADDEEVNLSELDLKLKSIEAVFATKRAPILERAEVWAAKLAEMTDGSADEKALAELEKQRDTATDLPSQLAALSGISALGEKRRAYYDVCVANQADLDAQLHAIALAEQRDKALARSALEEPAE